MRQSEGDLDLARSAAPSFAALGDPIRLAIVLRLGEDGPLPTIRLKSAASDLSRQGFTKHLRVLEEAGLVESIRLGRDRQWQLRPQRLVALRTHLDQIAAQWDARLDRLRAMVERSS